MRKPYIIACITVILLAIVVLFSGCVQQTSYGNQTIKVGVIIPLTGEVANLASSSADALEMAKNEINSAGGINGKKIDLIFEDGACNSKNSVEAVNKLINIDKVQVIVGGMCSAETLAAAPIAEQNKVVLISSCSSSSKVTEAGDYIFRDYPSDTFQGTFAAEYAYNTLHKRKVALLNTIGDWGTGLKDEFKKKFLELGGQIVAEESFEQSSNDMRAQLTKIKAVNPELVYMPAYTDGASIILKQAKELGINATFFDGDAGADPKIIASAGEAAEGFLINSGYPGSEDFNIKFKNKTGKDPLLCSANSYDALNIIAQTMKKVGAKGEDIKNALYNIKDFQGATGIIGFDSNGDRIKSDFDYIVKEVINGTFVTITSSIDITSRRKPTIKIGASLALTGGMALLGVSARDAMILAKDKLTDKKYNYDIIFEDDQLNPENAAKAANKLISFDNVNAIVSYSSGTGNVITPIAEQNKIVHMGMASDPNVANGTYSFIHATPPDEEAKAWVAEAEKRGVKRVAALFMNQQGILAIMNAIKQEIKNTDIQIVDEEVFNFGERDFRTMILKAKEKNPDIYLINTFSPELELLVKQLRESGITNPISSVEAFEFTDQTDLFEGQWYVNAADSTQAYADAYKAKYGKTPEAFSGNMYDIVLLLAQAFENAGDGKTIPSSDKVAAELLKIKDFSGALGNISIASDHIVHSKAVVRIIKDGKPVTISG